MKKKVSLFCLSIFIGIIFYFSLFKADLLIKNENMPEPVSEQKIIPEIDTICYGNDLKQLNRKEVENLISQREQDTIFKENDIEEAVYFAYSLLPNSIQEQNPLSKVLLKYETTNSCASYFKNNEGKLFISENNINPIYFSLKAFGKQIANDINIINTNSFKEIYKTEFGNQWDLEYCDTEEDYFSNIFARIILGGYEDTWNKIHTPITRKIVLDSIENYQYLIEKAKNAMKARNAFWDYTEQRKENTLSPEEQINTIINQFNPWLKGIIEKTGLTFEIVESFPDNKKGYLKLGCFYIPTKNIKNPKIQILNQNQYIETTVLHELGHFLDWYSGYKYQIEYASICENEFENCLWVDKDFQKYDIEEKSEYFANAFAYCLVDCEELNDYWKHYCPESL